MRKIENLPTQNHKPQKEVKISSKFTFLPTGLHIAIRLTIEPQDCGQLDPSEPTSSDQQVDSTGDRYEDYPEDQGGDLSGSDFVKIASAMKEYGNTAFKAGNLDLGLEKYQKGLRYLREYLGPDDHDEDEDDNDDDDGDDDGEVDGKAKDKKKDDGLVAQVRSLKFSLNSNSALLQLKRQSYKDALKSASNALDIEGVDCTEGERAKALYRRASAYAALKDDESAIADLQEAARLVPGDVAITRDLAEAKRREVERAKKEKATYRKFFE